MSAIALNRLAKHYDQSVALRDLSLEVGQGEFLTILGPSGSGKSTALALISGLASPTGGTIHLAGRDVTNLPPAQRNIGLVFQSYALFPHLDLFENIAFPLRIRKVDKSEIKRRVEEVIGLLRLTGLERRKPAQLSGGQQQRVALARAVVFRPDILLLDEPMGALDKKLREEVQIELRRLHRQLGTTTVLVTHDQEEALSLSDRIVVLADGRAEQVGTAREVYMRPANEFVAGFLGTANFLRGEWHVQGTGGRLVVDGGHVIDVTPPEPVPAGAVVAVARPEHAGITPRSPGAPGIPGTIRDAIYLGTSIRYLVDSVTEQPLVVAATASKSCLRVGDEVLVNWPEEALWMIPSRAS